MNPNRPYSIRIFLPGGDPEGLRTIEKSNWSGCGLVIPRALLPEAKGREELRRTGVYALLGPPEESGLPRLYLGEGDPVGPRLDSHAAKKDFWTTAIAFTSKDGNLNKAHVQYLESHLIALAATAKRCVLENGNAPQVPSLSNADAADAHGFLAEMLLCFPVLGVSVFSASQLVATGSRLFFVKAKGLVASGTETPQGFTVRAGSEAAAIEVPSCHAYIKELRSALIGNGVLKTDPKGYRFTQDYTFSSPSTGAGVVLGRSANGRLEWATKDGKTLRAVQESA